MQLNHQLHLTYCTNIHVSRDWDGLFANLRQYVPPLKSQLSPDQPFGIGLRLSGAESRELLERNRLSLFRDYLTKRGLYLFTLNGFSYGPFHRRVVKDKVHACDWRKKARVRYTLRLIKILANLLPEGVEGSISTNPLSYKPWHGWEVEERTWELCTRHLVEVAAELVYLREAQGKLIHLDIEPVVDGLIENSRDLVQFYQEWLLPIGAPLLAQKLEISTEEAESHLLEHIRVCWDTSHMALGYERPEKVLARFNAYGIKVGKMQISSAIKLFLPDDTTKRAALAETLRPFAESTHLHQVMQRNKNGTIRQYRDLDLALSEIQDRAATEWRIHYHLPVFIEGFANAATTQNHIVQTLALLAKQPFTNHLEIESYGWDLLPANLKRPLGESIQREFDWVLRELSQ
ncbi:MAG: metabolite traffic protein EboE [Ardenticatenaceae bacterium]